MDCGVRTQALKVNWPDSGIESDGDAGSSKGSPLNCAACAITPDVVPGTAFCVSLA